MARAKKADILSGPIHPDMPFDDKSIPQQTASKAATQPDYAAQLAELTANLQRLEEANNTLQRTNMALMGQGLQPQQPPQFGPTQVNLDNLPDPVTNPKEYAAEILNRGQQVLATQRQQDEWQRQQNQTMQQRLDSIWEQFGEAYPGFAGNADLVEAAATKAVEKARNQGIDPQKYMFAATPQFFADTVKQLQDWGIAGEATDDTEAEAEDTPAQRTAGIPGGIESGGALSKGKQETTAIPSLADEVRDWKLKTGWF